MAAIKEAHIKCGHCGHTFHSPIFFATTEAFESAFTAGNIAQCPQCHKTVHCNQGNMTYALTDDSGGFVGYDSGNNKA